MQRLGKVSFGLSCMDAWVILTELSFGAIASGFRRRPADPPALDWAFIYCLRLERDRSRDPPRDPMAPVSEPRFAAPESIHEVSAVLA